MRQCPKHFYTRASVCMLAELTIESKSLFKYWLQSPANLQTGCGLREASWSRLTKAWAPAVCLPTPSLWRRMERRQQPQRDHFHHKYQWTGQNRALFHEIWKSLTSTTLRIPSWSHIHLLKYTLQNFNWGYYNVLKYTKKKLTNEDESGMIG